MEFDFFHPRRTHICTVIQNLLKGIAGILLFLAVLMLINRFAVPSPEEDAYVDPFSGLSYVTTGCVILAIVVIYAIVGWRKKTYVISGQNLEVSGGVTTYTVTSLSIPGLSSIVLKQNLLQKLMGAACLTITGITENCGQTSRAEASVSLILEKREAEALRSLLVNKSNHILDHSCLKKASPSSGGSVYGTAADAPADARNVKPGASSEK